MQSIHESVGDANVVATMPGVNFPVEGAEELMDARRKLMESLKSFEQVAAQSMNAMADAVRDPRAVGTSNMLFPFKPQTEAHLVSASSAERYPGGKLDIIGPVPDWLGDLDLARFSSCAGDKPRNWKTVLCRHFQFNACKLGEKCNFVHEKGNALLAKSVSSGQLGSLHNAKTQLCKYFEIGTCMRGSSCSFAHGAAELQVEQPAELQRQAELQLLTLCALAAVGK